jgi:hypothetical protein
MRKQNPVNAVAKFLKTLGTDAITVTRNPHVFWKYRSSKTLPVGTAAERKAAAATIVETIGMERAYKVAVDNLVIATRGAIDFAALKAAPFDRPAGA